MAGFQTESLELFMQQGSYEVNPLTLGFLIVFSVILLNFSSNDILTYAEEENIGIVIKDSDLIVHECTSGLNLPVMIDFIDKNMLVVEKDGTTISSLGSPSKYIVLTTRI